MEELKNSRHSVALVRHLCLEVSLGDKLPSFLEALVVITRWLYELS